MNKYLIGTVHQWINIITYSLDMRDYYASIRKSGRVATIQDEIDTNILKCELIELLIKTFAHNNNKFVFFRSDPQEIKF